MGDISLWFLVLFVVFWSSYLFVDLASLEDGPDWDTEKFCPSLHPTLPLPALFFSLSTFSFFLPYNLFFSCKSCCFSMLLMKQQHDEQWRADTGIYSCVIWFWNSYSSWIFEGIENSCVQLTFLAQSYSILPIYTQSALWTYFFTHTHKKKKLKYFSDKFINFMFCLGVFEALYLF